MQRRAREIAFGSLRFDRLFMNTFHRLGSAIIWMGVQFMLFVAAYSIAYESVRLYRGSMRRDLGYGIMLQYGLYLFGALAAANGVLQTSALRLRAKIIGVAVCAGIFCVYLLPNLPFTPYRASLLLSIGIACLCVPLVANGHAQAGRRRNNGMHPNANSAAFIRKT